MTRAGTWKHLWNCVRETIKNNYQHISIKSASLRESFYIVRDILSKKYLQGGKLSKEEFDYFATDEKAYGYYTQDIWTYFEKNFGYVRPDAKHIGLSYWKELEYTINELNFLDSQARGYIYVEKEGIAQRLKQLSNYGWCVVAAQGQATREIRKLIKQDGRPCLIIHDYDPDGEIIAEAIKNKTRRTAHLDIALTDNAIDIGLNDEQVDFLRRIYDIPTQPLPTKWKNKWKRDYRVELSAFAVIECESGNAVLDFFKTELKRRDIPLSLTPIDKTGLFKRKVKLSLRMRIDEILDSILDKKVIKGNACKCSLEEQIDLRNNTALKKILESIIDGVSDKNVEWIYESDMEDAALDKTPTSWIKRDGVLNHDTA